MVSVAKMFSVCGTKARPCVIFSCAGKAVMSRPPRATRAAENRHDPRDRLDEGGLARAIGPQHHDQFARAATAKSMPRTMGRSRS